MHVAMGCLEDFEQSWLLAFSLHWRLYEILDPCSTIACRHDY